MGRIEELKQSAKILEQCLERMADSGPVNVSDPRVILPPKEEVYSTIEGTIQHFKIVMEGLKLPAGEVYGYPEGGNGELGFYMVSDGSGTPYRVRIPSPCFYITGGSRARHYGRHDGRRGSELWKLEYDRGRVVTGEFGFVHGSGILS